MFHPVGTVPMCSKELGGVVDPELRVYGVRNLRVGKSDISVSEARMIHSTMLYSRRQHLPAAARHNAASQYLCAGREGAAELIIQDML